MNPMSLNPEIRSQVGRCLRALLLVLFYGSTQAANLKDLDGNPCGDMTPARGAWNYWDQPAFMTTKQRAAEESRRQELEGHAWAIEDNWNNHLRIAKELMHTEIGTGQGGSVSGHLHFTLVRIPNHARALEMLIEYAFMIPKKPRHERLKRRPECYLQNAFVFAPKDAFSYGYYAIYLYKLKRYEQALQMFDKGLEIQPNSSELLYNKGLTLVRMERWEEATTVARAAYARGHKLPGLRAMLARKGIKSVEGAAPKKRSATP